jgi:hypothetical protein
MHRIDVDALDARRSWWVPAVRAPSRDWPGAPGCRRGARFLIDERSFRPSRDNYPCFESRAPCAWNGSWPTVPRSPATRRARRSRPLISLAGCWG